MSTGTCVPLRLSGSFVLSLGFQAGWARLTQNSSSLGLLLLTRILKVPVLPSRPGLPSHLSCRSQLSTPLPCLATTSCLCGCPGRWGFVQAFSCWYRWDHKALRDRESGWPGEPWAGSTSCTSFSGLCPTRELPPKAATGNWSRSPSPGTTGSWARHGQAPSKAFHTFRRAGAPLGCPLPLLSIQVPCGPPSPGLLHPTLPPLLPTQPPPR